MLTPSVYSKSFIDLSILKIKNIGIFGFFLCFFGIKHQNKHKKQNNMPNISKWSKM